MTEQLIIRLGSDRLTPIQWLVWSAQEQDIIASGELPGVNELHSLKDRAGGRPVTVLAPTSDIRMQWVLMPLKAGRKALAAIPYMLEDELSTDIDTQFFALGPKQGQQQAVAIVDKSKLQEWLNWLAEAGLVCNKLLPDILALPVRENGWSLLKIGNQIMVRQDQWRGIQGEQSWMLTAIEHMAKQQVTPLIVANYSDMALPGLQAQPEPLEMPMKVLALGALDAPFNLLQGEFKPKKPRNQQGSKWRLVAVLATIAVTTTLLDKGLQAKRLATERESLQQQIVQEFHRAFPEVKRVVNVKAQMTQKLSELQQGAGGVSMLVMLSQLSGAFEKSQIKPQTLKFDAKRAELRMQAAGRSFEALEQFRREAERQGFSVQQGAINNTDNQVIGTLTIRS